MDRPARLLILGGTGEARDLALRLQPKRGLAVTLSLAGRTRTPAAAACEMRRGGFGGLDGLIHYLRAQGVDMVVDGTHPFAARISGNAAKACRAVGIARLVLSRPAWTAEPGDRWIRVEDERRAAAAVADLGRRVFLTSGRRGLEAFSGLPRLWFLIRLIDAPETPLPLDDYELILGRGPFPAEAEAKLLRAHGIAAVVSKNSGGTATFGKIVAARRLGLPVVMIERPAPAGGKTVPDVGQAVAWVEARLPGAGPAPG